MRRPPRHPFHHSDLGGAFAAFAPEVRDDDKDVRPSSDAHLFRPIRHRHASILSQLIDVLCQRRMVSRDRLRSSLGHKLRRPGGSRDP